MGGWQFTFWLVTGLMIYIYAGYPLVVWILASLTRRTHRQAPISPTVSILVVAHNEEGRISQRIENLLALHYDGAAPQIVIASDASSDATVALAGAYRPAGVKVVAFERHRGKTAVLNELIPRLDGEIVILMDSRQTIAQDALQVLVSNFADPAVGAVSGELVLTEGGDGKSGVEGVGFYWRYEKFIRLKESRVDSTVGATGALYAIRRSLFEPVPEETILDDVLIPMSITRKGYRVLFEPKARAWDRLAVSAQAEFNEKYERSRAISSCCSTIPGC